MRTETITFHGPDLCSRKAAAKVRQVMLSHVEQGKDVVLDMSGVLSMSESYADELLGVPAGLHGLDWVSQNIKVQVSQEYVLRTIAVAIKRRLISAVGEYSSRVGATQQFRTK